MAERSGGLGPPVYLSGATAPDWLVLEPLLQARDFDGAIAVSEGVKQPAIRFEALVYVARHFAQHGDPNKAKQALATAEGLLEAAAGEVPADVPDPKRMFRFLELSVGYGALDPAKRSSYGDRAMEAAGKIRDAQVAANAVNRLTAGRLGLQPDLKWTASAFDQLAANFWQSGDRTHGRAAIALLKEVSQKGLPPDQGKSALWGVAMLQSRLGDYSGCAATLTSIDEDPRADLCRCMLEGKFPATAEEAREFLAVYRTLPVDDIDPGRSSRERMIRVLVKAGEVAEARKLATGKSPAQSALVGQLAVENHVAEAEKELAAVSDQGWHDESITLIADALLGHGDLNAAVRYLDLASSLNDGTYVIGSRIALACVKAGRFGEAARLGAERTN